MCGVCGGVLTGRGWVDCRERGGCHGVLRGALVAHGLRCGTTGWPTWAAWPVGTRVGRPRCQCGVAGGPWSGGAGTLLSPPAVRCLMSGPVGDEYLGGQEQRGDRCGVLQRAAGDLGWFDDACLDHV